MRFLMLVRATSDSEKGAMPSQEAIATMGKYNEELMNAGVLLELGGLRPTKEAVRVKLDGKGKKVFVDGPFAESKEIVAGFWIIQVKSREEALEWAKRIPMSPEGPAEVEIRQFFEIEDFGPGPATDRALERRGELERSRK